MENLVSIIITTKNEQRVIEALLKSIKNQSYKPVEIVLVDNNSSDNTIKIAKKFTSKIYTKGPERSVQRNYGVVRAKGEYILILDADMLLTKNVVSECVYLIQKNNAFGGIIIPEKSFGKGFWARCKAFEREFYLGEDSIEAARFFKKSVFNKFGGYDTTITGPEDWDLPLRMKKKGVKIGRINEFILHNEKRFSVWNSAGKKFYYARHSATYLKRHPETIGSHGNLLLRSIFFKKWRKLISNPVLAIGMFIMRFIEMMGAGLGILLNFKY